MKSIIINSIKKHLVILIVLSINMAINAILGALSPLLFKRVLENLNNIHYVIGYAGYYIMYIFISGVVFTILSTTVVDKINKDISRIGYQKLVSLSFKDYLSLDEGSTIESFSNQIEGLTRRGFTFFSNLIWYFGKAGISGSLLFLFSKKIGIAGILYALITIIINIVFIRAYNKINKKRFALKNEINSNLCSLHTAYQDMILFGNRERSLEKLYGSTHKYSTFQKKSTIIEAALLDATDVLRQGIVLFIISGSILFKIGYNAIEIITIESLIINMYYPIVQFIRGIPTILDIKEYYWNLKKVFDKKEENSGDIKIESIDSININNLSFGYNPMEPEVLNDLNLKIQMGKHNAICGTSGGGKSTLINLITKLFPSNGISINGIDISLIDNDSIRQHISTVQQSHGIFKGSVYDNIAYGRPDATEEEVVNAAKAACVDLNLYYQLLDKGSNISGGQIQRISIARALLKNSEILFLDEASSQLDPEIEERIYQNIKKQYSGKTILSIAHRLSTIKDADVINVLDGGKIIESGNYKELYRLGGKFKSFVDATGMKI